MRFHGAPCAPRGSGGGDPPNGSLLRHWRLHGGRYRRTQHLLGNDACYAPCCRGPGAGLRAYIGGWQSLSRSEEHTSELQSLMRISYAVFCLKKKITNYRAINITLTLQHK